MKEIARLDQSTFFKGKRTLVLQDDGMLKVFSMFDGQASEYKVDVGKLNPEPSREKKSARQMIVGIVFCVAISFLFLVFAILDGTHPDTRIIPFGLAMLGAIPGFLCWQKFKRQSYDIYIFSNPFTGDPLAIHSTIPDASVVGGFVEKLKREIQSRKASYSPSLKTLPEQIREVGKLHAEGLLTDDEFAQAKKNLLDSGKSVKPIGFGG